MHCLFQKRRKLVIASNITVFELCSIELTNLGDCDRLDLNYSAMKLNKMKNETADKIENIKVNLAANLKELEKEKSANIQVATSFSWLALLIILIFLMVIVLIDFHKLFLYLKENSLYICKEREKSVSFYNFEKNISRNNLNVFKQYSEKDKAFLNHP